MGMSTGGGGHDAPMMDINTTPLIDVMLVLLIMFIVTLPPATHAVKIDLPQDCKLQPGGCPPPPAIDPIKNTVYISPQDGIYWNNEPMTLSQLRANLDSTQNRDLYEIPPQLVMQPDPNARYARVDQVLAETKKAKVENMGFMGNENYMGEI